MMSLFLPRYSQTDFLNSVNFITEREHFENENKLADIKMQRHQYQTNEHLLEN